MSKPRCPGQDQRYWKPEDIYDVMCPRCGTAIEFWKDEPLHHCPECKEPVRNPKIDTGCAEWCKYADECLGGKKSIEPQINKDKHGKFKP